MAAKKSVKVCSELEEKLRLSRSLSMGADDHSQRPRLSSSIHELPNEPWNPFTGSKVSWFFPAGEDGQGQGSGQDLNVPKDHYKQRRKTANKENKQTPYALMMSGLHNVKANLLELKAIFDDDKLDASPVVYAVDFDDSQQPDAASDPESRAMDIDTLRSIINDSIEEIDSCIETMQDAGSLYELPQHMALRQLDTMLYEELQRVSETCSEFTQVSDFIATTYMENNVEDQITGCAIGDSGGKIGGEITSKPSMSNARKNYSFTNVMQQHGLASSDMAKLMHILTGIDHWEFDVFKLDRVCDGKPLTCIAYTLFQKYNLMETFQIPSKTLMMYLLSVEDSYLDNPFHNNLHAAAVTHATHFLLRAKVLEQVLTRLEVLAVIVAAAILDVGHPGVNNQFLTTTNSDLADMYNADSILEHHHLAVAFRLQLQEDCDIFASLDSNNWRYLRQMIAEIVLSTNKIKHNAQLASLKILVDDVKGKAMCDLPTGQRVDLLKVLVHCADVGSPARPLSQYKVWVGRLMEENYQQGEEEKRQGLPVSAMFDRRHANIPQVQVSFIDFIVQPMFSLLSELLHPHINDILVIIKENRAFWASIIEEEEATVSKAKTKTKKKTASKKSERRSSIVERTESARRLSCQLVNGKRFTFGALVGSESTDYGSLMGITSGDNIRFRDEIEKKKSEFLTIDEHHSEP